MYYTVRSWLHNIFQAYMHHKDSESTGFTILPSGVDNTLTHTHTRAQNCVNLERNGVNGRTAGDGGTVGGWGIRFRNLYILTG